MLITLNYQNMQVIKFKHITTQIIRIDSQWQYLNARNDFNI